VPEKVETRLLVEWARESGGLYTVADPSAPDVQRRYFAQAVSQGLPGFADVDYSDWRALLARLGRDAATARFRGPLILDDSPISLPRVRSCLQQRLDHDAKRGLGPVHGLKRRSLVRDRLGRLHFWARGFFVSTVSRDEERVRSYIQAHEVEDQRLEQQRLL